MTPSMATMLVDRFSYTDCVFSLGPARGNVFLEEGDGERDADWRRRGARELMLHICGG